MYSKSIPFLRFPDLYPECPSSQEYIDADNRSQQFTMRRIKSSVRREVLDRRPSVSRQREICSRNYRLRETTGDMYMVIMEALDITEDPWTRADSYGCLRDHCHRAPDLARLEAAVTTFVDDSHRAGYVHSDLWDVNLFVRDGEQGQTTQIVLLDFDRA
ncbi:hypothetical protein EV401DRAFT_1928948 [Pisolithus croceorrhizus]|nr:hypothetical protein EV401DRAFT_1928948 [Pisolithus croceorrhizus]